MVLQKSSKLDLPDTAFAQLAWGGDRANWPKRWREKLDALMGRRFAPGVVLIDKSKICNLPDCLHAAMRHRHLKVQIIHDGCLQELNPFATGGNLHDGFTYDFTDRRPRHPDPDEDKHKTKLIRSLRRSGAWCPVYLPALLFGGRVLGPGPGRILRAATHELTRVRSGRSDRPDRAELVSRGEDHPLLVAGRAYVGFNGNGGRKRPQYHGRGYSLRTWMDRAGYPHDPAERSFRQSATEFFANLKALAGPLGVTAAVRVPGRDGWLTVDQAADEVSIVRPQRMARECLLRVYGPADYPDRWRTFFSTAMGFGSIPRGEPGETSPSEFRPEPGCGLVTSEHLARWMKTSGWTDSRLADALGVCRTLVCKVRSGVRPPSPDFLARLDRLEIVVGEQ